MQKVEIFKHEPMIYEELNAIKVLGRGKINDFEYRIYSLGTHPTAYIKIPTTHPLYGVDYGDIFDIDVHCGFTYSKQEEDGYWLGWDYAHWGDYNRAIEQVNLNFDGYLIPCKKWTTDEILEECKNVVKQLEEYKGDNK